MYLVVTMIPSFRYIKFCYFSFKKCHSIVHTNIFVQLYFHSLSCYCLKYVSLLLRRYIQVFLIFYSFFSTSQIVVDGRDPKATDVEGDMLPTLVYLAREKRPQYFHNFKAGAMNALVIIYFNVFRCKHTNINL